MLVFTIAVFTIGLKFMLVISKKKNNLIIALIMVIINYVLRTMICRVIGELWIVDGSFFYTFANSGYMDIFDKLLRQLFMNFGENFGLVFFFAYVA